MFYMLSNLHNPYFYFIFSSHSWNFFYFILFPLCSFRGAQCPVLFFKAVSFLFWHIWSKYLEWSIFPDFGNILVLFFNLLMNAWLAVFQILIRKASETTLFRGNPAITLSFSLPYFSGSPSWPFFCTKSIFPPPIILESMRKNEPQLVHK